MQFDHQSGIKLHLFGQSESQRCVKKDLCISRTESNSFLFSFCFRSVAEPFETSEALSYVDQLPVAEIIHQVRIKLTTVKKSSTGTKQTR